MMRTSAITECIIKEIFTLSSSEFEEEQLGRFPILTLPKVNWNRLSFAILP